MDDLLARISSPSRELAAHRLVICSSLCVSLGLLLQSCGGSGENLVSDANTAETAVQVAALPPPPPPPPRLKRAELWNNGKPREVVAAWYEVPNESLAKRRAGEEEYTAAHNRLPIGTLVRVTHLKNGKSVLVRITDRGIRDTRIKLDLCKEAAEQLGMLRKGLARVRMEVLAETKTETSGSSLADSQTSAPLR